MATDVQVRSSLTEWLKENDQTIPCPFCGNEYVSPAVGEPWHDSTCPFAYVRAALAKAHGMWAPKLGGS